MEKAVRTLFTPVSQNAKTGPIPVTITEKASCWTGCALYEKGCYAFYGALGHFWSGVSEGTRGGSWDELCGKIAALPKRTLWRYAQAGDLPGSDDAIDTKLLRQLIIANRGKRVIAFTHKPVLPDTPIANRNRSVIAAANADRPSAGQDAGRSTYRSCPATYTGATCKSCGARAEKREAVIGFPAHGPWRMVENAIAARDVPVG